MASIFDSPLFWIIVVWWLLTTFLGGKARRRRAMRARSAQPDQPAAPFGRPQPEIEPAFLPGQERPAEIEVEADVLEAEPSTTAPGPQEYPDRTGPPAPPTRPVSPLEDLFRKLGVAEELVPAVLRPEEEEAPLTEELEITTMPELVEEPPTPLPVEPPPARAREYIPAPRRRYPLLAETTLDRLTPLQQVVIFKEILDRPRAQRRAIR
ncbi:MAG: hypothetical protein GH143_01020 [Calditrichaeota bacterium]|nr:hypothetical protein [Calditrichota bacterium]